LLATGALSPSLKERDRKSAIAIQKEIDKGGFWRSREACSGSCDEKHIGTVF
jgi:hypothetical protein